MSIYVTLRPTRAAAEPGPDGRAREQCAALGLDCGRAPPRRPALSPPALEDRPPPPSSAPPSAPPVTRAPTPADSPTIVWSVRASERDVEDIKRIDELERTVREQQAREEKLSNDLDACKDEQEELLDAANIEINNANQEIQAALVENKAIQREKDQFQNENNFYKNYIQQKAIKEADAELSSRTNEQDKLRSISTPVAAPAAPPAPTKARGKRVKQLMQNFE